MGWATKSFLSGWGFLTESKKFIESTINKLDVIYYGSESYLKNLLRKNNPEQVHQILDEQEKEAQKVLDKGYTMVAIFRMMMPYLEYKERKNIIPEMDAALKIWEEKAVNFMGKLHSLPQTISHSMETPIIPVISQAEEGPEEYKSIDNEVSNSRFLTMANIIENEDLRRCLIFLKKYSDGLEQLESKPKSYKL